MNKKIIVWISILTTILMITSMGAMAKERFNMSYLYGNYDYISKVEATNGALDEVSPSYFDLNVDGSLHLNTVDKNLVNEMHKRNIKVVPFLSNHWDRSKGRNALSNASKLANELANAVIQNNLDGVNVDIENVTEADRDKYTELVRALRVALPQDKKLAVAVAANPWGLSKGWQGSYDYYALGEVADYLMIMAYDEHYEGGEAGAVASLKFVEDSIKYALNYVPKEKIVLGVPFFGRFWKEDGTIKGRGVSIAKVEDIISKYDSKVTYDEASDSVKAIVTIKAGDAKPSNGGKTLSAGTYTFWYENEKSLTKKLELINKYDLKGSGSWSLGQESKATWNYYKKVLDGGDENGFRDVLSGYWAYDAIMTSKNKGWIIGDENGKFNPEGKLTRAEFATIISRLKGLSLTDGMIYYPDTEKHWAITSINAIVKEKLMIGYVDGMFRPNGEITREEVCKVLALMTNMDTAQYDKNYKDVTSDRWSYDYIMRLSQSNIINGYTDGSFRPQNAITRAEVVTMLSRI